jgi:hypothetical protein
MRDSASIRAAKKKNRDKKIRAMKIRDMNQAEVTVGKGDIG